MSNIALFIDGDNVNKNSFQKVFDEIKIRGRICIKRIYFDFNLKMDEKWKQIILSNGIESVSVINLPSKNSTDIKLMLDMIKEYYSNPIIDTYIIMSSDSDFYHIATFLRSNGKIVICYGENHTPPLLKNVCDEFILCRRNTPENSINEDILYTNLKAIDPYIISISQIENGDWKKFPYYVEYKQNVYLLKELVEQIKMISMNRNLEFKNLSILKDLLKRSDPSFNERNWNFYSFKNFVSILLKNFIKTSYNEEKRITQIDKILF
jgi:uncharacterized LabA/DUF88 family protein